jgi:putative transposase
MAHSCTNLIFYIVYGTSERRLFIDEEFQPRLYEYVGGTIRGLKGTSLEVGGVEHHIHILVKLPPTIVEAAKADILLATLREKFPLA